MTGKSWKPLDLAKATADYLDAKGVPSARLDAEILLCRALGLAKRIDLYAGFANDVPEAALAAYRDMVRRRAGREPVSRILGERDFMGLRFEVTPDVLSPRPETELLVEAALAFLKPTRQARPAREDDPALAAELERLLDSYAEDAGEAEADGFGEAEPLSTRVEPRGAAGGARMEKLEGGRDAPRILDLGAGSGCVAVALAAMAPDAKVTAVDISPAALATARRNAEALGVGDRVEFRLGDWFGACRDGEVFDAIVSNPPYLVEGDPGIWPEVSGFDPPLALYAGPDGLDCLRAIVTGAGGRLARSGMLFLEVGAGQAEAVEALLGAAGFDAPSAAADYSGVRRVISAGLGK